MNASRIKRIVIVANRLPLSLERVKRAWQWRYSSGGLVTALEPIMRERGGVWIGWPGSVERVDLDRVSLSGAALGYEMKPVWLRADERDKFYLGFSNAVIWPLFHSLQTVCDFDPKFWTMYRWVNRKFARATRRHARPGDFVWVHDYHLMLVAQELQRVGFAGHLCFFLHIPFPSPDIYMKMPWRREILAALLEYDFLGFQTVRDRRNFIACVRQVLDDVTVRGRGPVVALSTPHRSLHVGTFPISIDFKAFAETAGTRGIADMALDIHRKLPGRQLVLGVDRLDYTKGLPYKLDAFRAALERFPDLRRRISLIQVVVPSREDIAPYHDLKRQVDRLVGEINGEYTEAGWVPIHYIFRHLDHAELLSLYRTAEIALVTPLEDGMNLIAKEFCAATTDENGVLILSEFCGAAEQMRHGALLVNPYDRDGVARAIHQAFRMPQEERRARMRRLRYSIEERDIYWWAEAFLRAGQDPEGYLRGESGESRAAPDL